MLSAVAVPSAGASSSKSVTQKKNQKTSALIDKFKFPSSSSVAAGPSSPIVAAHQQAASGSNAVALITGGAASSLQAKKQVIIKDRWKLV